VDGLGWLVGLVVSSHLAVFAEQVLEVALLSLGCKAVNKEVVAGVDALVDVGADDKRILLSWRVSVRLVIEVGISSCDQALSLFVLFFFLFRGQVLTGESCAR
jgi:hypothetical protein